jgi:hypothetical protein
MPDSAFRIGTSGHSYVARGCVMLAFIAGGYGCTIGHQREPEVSIHLRTLDTTGESVRLEVEVENVSRRDLRLSQTSFAVLLMTADFSDFKGNHFHLKRSENRAPILSGESEDYQLIVAHGQRLLFWSSILGPNPAKISAVSADSQRK